MVFGSRGQISAAFPGTHGCVRAPNDTVYVFNSTDGKGLDGWLGAARTFLRHSKPVDTHVVWAQIWQTRLPKVIYLSRECKRPQSKRFTVCYPMLVFLPLIFFQGICYDFA